MCGGERRRKGELERQRKTVTKEENTRETRQRESDLEREIERGDSERKKE